MGGSARTASGADRTEDRRRELRSVISAAAVDLVIERGLDAVTVDEIARAANVSRRTFFNYFPSKEDAVLGLREPVVSEEMADTYLTNAQRIAESEGAENIEVITTPGDPVNALIEVTEKYDVELLVVGNRGVNSVRGRVFGSVPTELTHKSKVDVVVVNTSEKR